MPDRYSSKAIIKPSWSALLFWQISLLAFCCGILACRLPGGGLLGFAVLYIAGGRRVRALFPLLFLLFCFTAGFAYTAYRTPDPVAFSAPWMQEALDPEGAFYTTGLRVSAVVQEVSSMPGERLRLILDKVRPIDLAGFYGKDPKNTKTRQKAEQLTRLLANAQELPGRLTLTWQDPPFYVPAQAQETPIPSLLASQIIAGQTLVIDLKVRTVRGLLNQAGNDVEEYWQNQAVWSRGWTRANEGLTEINGQANASGLLREKIRLKIYRSLPRQTPLPKAAFNALPADAQAIAAEDKQEQPATKSLYADAFSLGASFIPALLMGDRFLLTPDQIDLFSDATLSHSLALSGLHLGYAAGLGYLLAKLLFLVAHPWLARRQTFLPSRKKLELVFALLPAAFYIWLGGASPSLLRSGLMLLFWGILLWLERPAVLLDGLLWAVGVILLFDPLALFDLRLQLSALAVLAIALSLPLLDKLYAKLSWKSRSSKTNRLQGIYNVLLKGLIFLFGTSLAVQIVLTPLTLTIFGQIGLSFPLNIIWLPVLGTIVMPLSFAGLIAAMFDLNSVATWCFSGAALPCAKLLELLNWLQSINFMPAPTGLRPLWFGVAGFWLLMLCLPLLASGKSGRRSLCILLMLGFTLLVTPSALRLAEQNRDFVRLHVLDVGQGQAVLLEWAEDGTYGRLLLDGGGVHSNSFDTGQDILMPIITHNQAPKLEFMANTHADLDHLRGLIYPLRKLQVQRFADNGAGAQAGTHGGKYNLEMEKALRVAGFYSEKPGKQREVWNYPKNIPLTQTLQLETLHPNPQYALELSKNNAALVLRLTWHEEPLALLCGDIEKRGLRILLGNSMQKQRKKGEDVKTSTISNDPQIPPETLEPAELQAPVLLLPHHGSVGSFLPQFHDAVNPVVAIVSCAYGNQWGFPAASVQKDLQERNVPLYSTAENGQITLEWTNWSSQEARKPKVVLARNTGIIRK